MSTTRVVAVALATLVVATGVAAATPPGDAPDRRTNETRAAADAAPSPRPADTADERGPPAALLERVPDHVEAIHDAIRSLLTGDLDGRLGDAVSGLLDGDASADRRGTNAGATADARPNAGVGTASTLA